ncbi:sulfite exporter TauE/SafE family protein [Conexibacter stalactiti]|uniref:Probable membrane transporter protein n=1 Tax=Conexibacter stalactiti TaxID=1940611 RepID=A0ABU4HS04_9ACTN|nr:sulfite exporter TauE/SafE family protein [Conexibacter stalactiti]MDW5596116.1 sulfite exporter TauE/SafE family protein [Conexibacter stalactiti]MEC5036758.1 sulfite exporter TauE/SafE family protein [Conexibacter stalactiti]
MSTPAAAGTLRAPGARAITGRAVLVGVIGGLLSGLLGVGGGVIMIPLLVLWFGLDQRSAHAVSLAAIIPISIGGIVTYGAAGEVDVVQAIMLALGSIVGARYGAKMLADIEPARLQFVFGIFLVGAAIVMAVTT